MKVVRDGVIMVGLPVKWHFLQHKKQRTFYGFTHVGGRFQLDGHGGRGQTPKLWSTIPDDLWSVISLGESVGILDLI